VITTDILCRRLMLIVVLVGLYSRPGFAGHGVGNPGNAFDAMMVSACERAYRMIDDPFWTGNEVPEGLINFMTKHRTELLKSIRECDLRFSDSLLPIEIEGITPSCARTNVDPQLSGSKLNTIFISRPTCVAQGVDEGTALLTIIHENIHHLIDAELSNRPDLRISDEGFCDQTALAIVSAWEGYLESKRVQWLQLPSVPKNTLGRSHHSSVLVGDASGPSKVLIWGGCFADASAMGGCNRYLRSGVELDLPSRKWTSIGTQSLTGFTPDERSHHTAVWTSQDKLMPERMIVWGGCNGADACFNSLNDGGIYDPKSGTWAPLNDKSENRPSARVFHSAAWTPKGMLIWGGLQDFESPEPGIAAKPLSDGAIWSPTSGVQSSSWQSMPTANQPSPRSHHSSLWTGTELIVWGGCARFDLNNDCVEFRQDGARFNVDTMQWSAIPKSSTSPAARSTHQAFWTGEHMIIWGGENSSGPLSNGAIYSPSRDQWFPIADQNNVEGLEINATWTGDRVVFWNGRAGDNLDLFQYFPPAGDQLEFGGIWQSRIIDNGRSGVTNGTFMSIDGGILQWGGETATGVYPTDAAVLRY
jgi:hypothetical protein